MTKEEREKLDAFNEEYTKNEVKFLEENGAETNEHGVYIYESKSGNHSVNMAYYLRHYRDFLIDNKILNEPK
jgi:hypothetical protein